MAQPKTIRISNQICYVFNKNQPSTHHLRGLRAKWALGRIFHPSKGSSLSQTFTNIDFRKWVVFPLPWALDYGPCPIVNPGFSFQRDNLCWDHYPSIHPSIHLPIISYPWALRGPYGLKLLDTLTMRVRVMEGRKEERHQVGWDNFLREWGLSVPRGNITFINPSGLLT